MFYSYYQFFVPFYVDRKLKLLDDDR